MRWHTDSNSFYSAKFAVMFHFIMGILIFVGGLLVSLNAFGRHERSAKVQASCVSVIIMRVNNNLSRH